MINLKKLLSILKKNEFIILKNEENKILFKGPAYRLRFESAFYLSCLVLDCYKDVVVNIIITDM